ncbi:MAG: hypothetical protein GF317_23020 [Candidatus Lokiarchaeota archaeon]|nr:hypothetical protein [Candidatus Lokiarchaeota archaeon]MBD3202316.1 hypothetical protein [Candidatus Lokiarchaeota archaeon]
MSNASIKVEKEKQSSKKRIMIISDSHITPYGTEFNEEAFDAGIKAINKIKDVSIYLHLGDLTQNGTLLDYQYALIQMNKLNPKSDAPVKYVIGNHDSENVGYLLFEDMIGKRHFEYEDNELFMIGIDSTKPDLASGIIHQNTINSVKTRLEAIEKKEKLKIVCFHHQLIPIPKTGKERSAIDDSGDMLQMLLEAGADLVINGHRHISNLYNMGSQEKDMFIFNAGTFSCNKTRYRELFTFSVIDIIDNKINFKVLPIMESQYKKEINREIISYNFRKPKLNEKPLCKLIQLSNTLIEDSNKQRSSLNELVTEINNIENVELIVHVGNLTKNGYEEEFAIAREYLEKFEFPLLAVPGHSDSHPLAWNHWQRYIGPLDPSYKSEKLYIQGINSCTQDSNIGYIGRKRLRLLIEKVLRFSSEKIVGFTCFHGLIPTPLSIWRTELSDSGDVLAQLALSQIDLILNSTPSVSFNLRVENSLISNGGSLQKKHFEDSFIEIDIYNDGLINLIEHKLKRKKANLIGKYKINIFS